MHVDSTTVEIISNSLVYASEEMGIALRNSAYSPNIRERMDHSAAIFDDEGRLLAQAEHIPVHLGSLPWGLVKTLEYCDREGIDLGESAMIMVNNPYIAGTHLNDVTVIRPVYQSNSLVGYTANKAHHADVGGKVPGSISIDAKTLFEEGVVIDPRYLIRKNRFVNIGVTALSSKSRTPRERIGDLKAQTAANIIGERRVLELVKKHGRKVFQQACTESLRKTEQLMRLRLSKIPSGTYRAQDFLEDPDGHDIRLKVSLTLSKGRLKVDYTGTDWQVPNPLNAVIGVTLSGVFYVTRTLTGDDIPANHGAFTPVTVHAPEGTILNPTFPHPVAGGNLETSQRNPDLPYRAFSKAIPDRVPADSGGSMNNVMMGGTYKGRNKPRGLFGGGSGALTEVNLYKTAKGKTRKTRLSVKVTLVLRKGDVIEIRTAGGGGYGNSEKRERSRIKEDVRHGIVTSRNTRRAHYQAEGSTDLKGHNLKGEQFPRLDYAK